MAGVSIFNDTLISDASLVNYYRLNGNAVDAKGAANGVGTAMAYSTLASPFLDGSQGGVFTANTPGGSGATSYITAAYYSPGTHDFTYYCWVNFSGLTGTQSPLHNEANGATGRPSLTIDFDGTNFSTTDNTVGGTATATTSGFTPVVGTWYQLAITRTGGTLTLYINGVSKATVADSLTSISSSNGSIGARQNTTYGILNAFYGYMADVAMFNRVLTTTELLRLYNSATVPVSIFGSVTGVFSVSLAVQKLVSIFGSVTGVFTATAVAAAPLWKTVAKSATSVFTNITKL